MQAPVCITGMHRSGTSMLALLLRACGLDLGDRRHFAPVNPDNRLGFAEDLRFVILNDRLLARAGGAWDRPPDPARIGRGLPGLFHRGEARRLLRHRAAHHRATGHPWGWKDPRMALTMPFWLPLVPDLKVIICLRHPAEVARSLAGRTYGRSDDGEALWLEYNRRLLNAVPQDRRLIVANADVLEDGAVPDDVRTEFLFAHLAATQRAIEAGANVKGFFYWSLLDNYEWAEGFEKRFGLVHVDYASLKRSPKSSYHALARALARNDAPAGA